MAKSNLDRAVNLLVADMDKKSKVKSRGPDDPAVYVPDSRVARFAISYLDAFGYLKSELEQWKDISLADIIDAITHFQGIFHVPTKKALTIQTVRAMEGQRCGCPDIQRGHHSCKRMMKAVTRNVPKWKKDGLTYHIEDRLPNVPADSFDAAIRSGFLAWSIYANLKITPAESPDTADVMIGTGKGPQSNFDGPGGTLAWATMPDVKNAKLWMMFDQAETWVLDTKKRGVCLHNVVRHEIGHLLGLTHSKVQGALMAPFYSPSVRDPQQDDDIPRLLTRYGHASTAPQARTQIVPMPVQVTDAVAVLEAAGYKVEPKCVTPP